MNKIRLTIFRECVLACPFGAMQFDDVEGTAAKCDLCLDWFFFVDFDFPSDGQDLERGI